MIDLIQSILLSDILIFIALIGAFVYLSRRALDTREYTGYALGWLVGLFFMVIYSSMGPRNTIAAQEVGVGTVQLSFFEIFLPTMCGILVGVGLLMLIGLAQNAPRRYTLLISVVTALNVILVFLMFVVTSDTRRMIGIFALAFAICAITTSVLFGRTNNARGFGAQTIGDMPNPLGGEDPQAGFSSAPPLNAQSRIEQIRNQFRKR